MNWVCDFLTGVNELVAIIIGWLLGLVSTAGAWLVGTIVKRSRFEKTVKVELNEVRVKVASFVFLVSSKRGGIDKETVGWCLNQLKKCPGTDECKRIIDNLTLISESEEEHLDQSNRNTASTLTDLPALAMPRVYLPFLSSNADSIALVCENKRAALVQILSHIEVLNGKIDDMTFWDRLTFDPGNNSNYTTAIQNSEMSKDAILAACKRIANLIDQI